MAAHDAKVSGSPSSGEDPGDTFFPGLLVSWDELTRDEVAGFKTALDAARDEGDMQRFLETHPCLLIQHLTAGRRAWVIPQQRLGSEHVTDFLIAQKAADGFVWYAVELERPQAKLFNKNGDPSATLNHALRQISDWRDWLSHNLDYAARPPERSGIGLIDIHPELDGLIIMGRDAEVDRRATALRRQRLERAHRIKIETYDWLLAQASDRLAALDKRATDIISQHPLYGPLDAMLRSPKTPPPLAEVVVREVFGGIISGWTGASTVRDEVEWEGVEIWPYTDVDNQVVAPLKIVYAQGSLKDKLLQPGDWQEWIDYVTSILDADHSLLVTEIEPAERLQDSLNLDREGTWYLTEWYPWIGGEQRLGHLHVLVHLPPVTSVYEKPKVTYDQKRSRIAAARDVMRRYISDQTLEQRFKFESERAARLRIASLALTPGDMVSHDRFGLGVVVSVTGSGAEVMIDFGQEYGVKRLMLRYAPIAKL